MTQFSRIILAGVKTVYSHKFIDMRTVKDVCNILQRGANILEPVLVPHGFQFRIVASGRSSGGPSAHGEYTHGGRRLELHFRYSLGLVTYHVGALSLAHDDYMRALLGRSGAGNFPLFSEEPLSGFEALKLDLINYCSDFISGTAEEFRRCVKEHERYEALTGLQKIER